MKQSLLAQYIAGACTDAERQAVEEWAASAPEHAAEIARLRRLWEGSSKPPDYQPDTDVAWASLKREIEEDAAVVKPLWQRTRAWSVSATIVLLAAVGLWFVNEQAQVDEWEHFATADTIKVVELEDGTTVTLNRNSSLEVAPGFATNRETRLKGEAFFAVTKDPKHPFRVNTSSTQVEVLGTRFNLRSEEEVSLAVEEGKVAFSGKKKADSLHVSAGQAAIFNNTSLKKVPYPDPNLEAWRTGIMKFDDHDIAYIIEIVQSMYGVNIAVDSALQSCKMTAPFENKELNHVMMVIAAAIGAEATQTAGGWKLSGEGCQ